MNPAIWKKAFGDAWRQLLLSCLGLVAFSWLYVWVISLFEVGAVRTLLKYLPDLFRPILGVPTYALATSLGQLSVLYVHVITLLVCIGWALGRGSDSISGEIARGTMDLILSLPIWRVTAMIAPAVVATIGAAVLAASVWLGIALGLWCFKLEEPVAMLDFLPGAINLFLMTFAFTGMTTFVSSWNRDRWQTMSWAGGFFIVSLIIKIVARMWPRGAWLNWFTFLSLFEPQVLILIPDPTGWQPYRYGIALAALGLLSYAAAGVVLWWRDIPTSR